MKLTEVTLSGYKSIDQSGQTIRFGDVTLLIGANGAGKSNLLSFFRMLAFMMTGSLQHFVGRYGARQLLFYGPKVTESISFKVVLRDEKAQDTYDVKLSHGLPERLFVSGEQVTYHLKEHPRPQSYDLDTGGGEAALPGDKRQTSQVLTTMLRQLRAFQFHDTSENARIKERAYVDDASYLRSDAGNLAAVLKHLKETPDFRPYYERIVRHVQRILPQLNDFELDTLPGNDRFVRLNWSDRQRPDHLFGPDQLSDGSLRFIALTTLLMQPPRLLPSVIVLDEPELGLHPSAIMELASMIKRCALTTQLIIATQSTRLVDEFCSDQIVVVERDPETGASSFKRLDDERLASWLERYSLSELWEKNVIGGQP